MYHLLAFSRRSSFFQNFRRRLEPMSTGAHQLSKQIHMATFFALSSAHLLASLNHLETSFTVCQSLHVHATFNRKLFLFGQPLARRHQHFGEHRQGSRNRSHRWRPWLADTLHSDQASSGVTTEFAPHHKSACANPLEKAHSALSELHTTQRVFRVLQAFNETGAVSPCRLFGCAALIKRPLVDIVRSICPC